MTPNQDDFLSMGMDAGDGDDLFGGVPVEPLKPEPPAPEPAPADDMFGDALPAEPSAAQGAGAGESYVVVARRYRPQTFDQLVGQQNVRSALEGAIRGGQIGHAYLFCGPRGTGKTSTARILAKAVNCLDGGPRPDPCGVCASCRAITAGSSLDVIEIDAASNTGVDNIRDLRTGVVLAPFSRFKVYIVDEVHMLSIAAFNALLKTLEEPPSQVIFVLATTDPQKVPDTIVSRCQLFQFRRFSTDEIVNHLGRILDTEAASRGLVIPEEDRLPMLEMIARNAEGGMRDAQVSLDQVLVLCRDRIDVETVRRFLGSVRLDLLDGFIRGIRERRTADLLEMVQQLSETGQDIERFTASISEYIRDLLVARSAPQKRELLNVSGERFEALRALAGSLPQAFLIQLADVFLSLSERMKTASQTRFLLEVELVRLSRVDALEDISTILERLSELERRLAGGGGTPPPPASAPPVESKPAMRATAPGESERRPAPPAADRMQADPVVVARSARPAAPAPPAAVVAPPVEPEVVGKPAEPPVATKHGEERPNLTDCVMPDALMTALRQALPEASLLNVALQDATVVSVAEGCVVLGVKPGDTFTYSLLSRPVHHAALREAINGLLGREVMVRLELLRGDPPKETPSQSRPAVAERRATPHMPAPLPVDAASLHDDDADEPREDEPLDDELMAIREQEAFGATRTEPVVPPPAAQERPAAWRVMRGNEMREYLDGHAETKDVFQKIKSAFRLPDSQIVLRTRA